MGIHFAFDEGMAGQVAATGQPRILNNYFYQPGRAPQLDAEPYRFSFYSAMGVPMIWQGRVIGVLGLVHKVKGKTFSQRDVELLERFAGRATIAVENARLYEK